MGWLDWTVVAVYAALMLSIGVYYSSRNESAEDFLLGGRRMSPVMVGLSLCATLISTLSYLGVPGEMIAHGPMMSLQIVAHPIVFVIVGFGLIPLLMRQPVTSAYELLETRLGGSIRLAGATVFLLLRFGWMATILYATAAVILVPLLGLHAGWVPWLCLGMGTFIAAYASWGGIKAVVVTDAVQSITMLAGVLVTLGVITIRTGGISGWWPHVWPEHWQPPSWGFDPDARVSFGVLVISMTVWYVCTNGSDQMSIQRFLSTRDAKSARRTLLVAQISDALIMLLLGVTGAAVLGYFRVCKPESIDWAQVSTTGDKLFPRFIMEEMPAGLSGLVLAALLAAAMSSLSSGLNSVCAVLDRDFLSRRQRPEMSPAETVARLRWLTWCVAAAVVALSMLNLLIVGNLLERCYKVINLLTAPLFVLFFLAMLVPWSNGVGAWCGLIASVVTAVTIAYAPDLNLPVGISFVWMMPCSLLVGIVVGTTVSALAGQRKRVT